MKLKVLNILFVPIKFFMIFFITQKAFDVLMGEDNFYSDRKINNFCQKAKGRADQKICQKNKFKKFMLFYVDSFPYDLFCFNNKLLEKHANSFKFKHYGVTDSGPALSSFTTGKLSNKYEGTITYVDNIFAQLKQADYNIHAFGYDYPIEEMIGRDYFKTYTNIEKGLHEAMCEDFIDLTNLQIPNVKFVKDSLIFSEQEFQNKLEKYYTKYKQQIRGKKENIFKCLKEKTLIEDSFFLYNVYTDKMGHLYSRQSEFYIQRVAAAKANFDVLIEFYQKKQQDAVLIIMSDHGVVSSLWEAEINNHGVPSQDNESFLYYTNSKLNNNVQNKPEYLDSFQLPAFLAQIIQNVNIPVNSIARPIAAKLNRFSEIAALRSKEGQLLSYFKSFKKSSLKKQNINLQELKKQSPFNNLKYFINKNLTETDQNVPELIQQYNEFLTLLQDKQQLLITENNKKNVQFGFFAQLSVILIFIIPACYKIYNKVKHLDKTIWVTNFLILLILPLCFYYNQKIIERSFIPYFFISYGLFLFVLAQFNIDKILIKKICIFILLAYCLIIFDKLANLNNFYFFYYQNSFLQYFMILVYIIINGYALFKIQNYKINQFCKSIQFANFLLVSFLLIDFAVILYEIKLIYSIDYNQDFFMAQLSKVYYFTTLLSFLLALNFPQKWKKIVLILVVKSVFWLGTNYMRIAVYLIMLPVLYFISKFNNKQKKNNYQNFSNILILIYFSWMSFKTLRGELDNNISVRVAHRSFCYNIEQCTTFTAVIFVFNKFLIFFFLYFYLPMLNTLQIKNTFTKLDIILVHFDNIFVNIIDCWFGFGIAIYFMCLDDPLNQRSAFMFHSANIILLGICYGYQLIDLLLQLLMKQKKYLEKAKINNIQNIEKIQLSQLNYNNQLLQNFLKSEYKNNQSQYNYQ